MTISTTSVSVTESGNSSQTVFPFAFASPSITGDIAAYLNTSGTVTLIPANEITVTFANPPVDGLWPLSGTAQYPISGSPIATGTTITLERILPLTQVKSLDNQGNQYPAAIESALDTLCMQIQQVNAPIARSLQFPVVDSTSFNPVLPAAAARANGYLAFDTLGNVIITTGSGSTSPISSVMAPVVAASTLAIGRTAFGLGAAATENLGGNIIDDGSGNLTISAAAVLANGVTATTQATNNYSNLLATTMFVVNTAISLIGQRSSFNAITGNLPTAISGTNTTAAITISSGIATDSTNSINIYGAGYSWAASNGNAINGTDAASSTLANSSTYHMYICFGSSGTGTFVSASSSPTFPAGYNSNHRRIFSFNTNSSGAPIPYTAIETEGGSYIAWLTTQLLDGNNVSIGTSAVALTLTVPGGSLIKVQPFFRASTGGGAVGIIFTSGNETDVAPSGSPAANFTAAPGFDFGSNGSITVQTYDNGPLTTNSTSMILVRATTSTSLYLVTRGFKDFRRN